ncbi:MAG: diguanylate cyclase, partial [Treponema sp.]|nr:diguanylate cyclase [Treponema sp.]
THILSPDYTVYAVKNGLDAILAAEKHLPDIILLDIIMPGNMDGFAVIDALKKSEATQEIPVIYITDLSNPDDEEKGLSLGASDYIPKPFFPAIVKLRVQNQMKMLNQLRTIEQLSMMDQLTNLPNRRNFDNRLNKEWDAARREKMPLSLLVMDVDRFKNYNDTYGHQQGDVALQVVAKIITQLLKRPTDFASRWGGEEFTALLPHTELTGAMNIAEDIRCTVENTEISHSNGSKSKVTISIGVNTKIPERDSPLEDFISRADKALYKAKEDGRNRVHGIET